ncbi:FAD-dependent oxidoreductase [Paraburkholderia phosphatilytica]|uniref:FAD-dependent oxidoreductase n=1 Tax=Paraburkholderia phosphatilytica TaxID=2282883 RepID=UPI000E4C36AF|nr:FAD-dependent oxidoreductase [Paraburkholderia phosphatilytica]
MDVIVIGGGITGVATAYQLRAAGHRVCVIERHATVAQGATYGHGGTILPTTLDVWFGPTFMQQRRAERSGVVSAYGFNAGARDFVKRIAKLREPNEFGHQFDALRPLIERSRDELAEIEARFGFEFEQRNGVLQLIRSQAEWDLARPAVDLLRVHEIPHHILTAAECSAHEHAVPADPPFASGVLLEHERVGNCPLFTKLLRQALDLQDGVQFLHGRAVTGIRVDPQRAAVELGPRDGEAANAREVDVMQADAIVVAAGAGSLALLDKVGVKLPFHPLRMHTLVAPIAHEECVPHSTVVDAVKRITITRMNHRLRIAGGAVLQPADQTGKPLPEKLTEEALALLGEAARDWIPGAAKISAALPWEGVTLLSPDGLPAVGTTSHKRLFVNVGHGPTGWGLACGSAKVVADLVTGDSPAVPEHTLKALQPGRFKR